MSEQEFGYTGKGKVAIPDPLFLYIEWETRANPKNNTRLAEIIEDLDLEYFPNPRTNIKNSLPFLTFRQAEVLFRSIRDTFGFFGMEGVALATQVDNKGNLTGRPSTHDQPVISPFEIDQTYDNIVIPLIEATFRDVRFQNQSYDDLARYFTAIEYNLMDCYGASLGLSRSQFPQFPAPGSIEGELPRLVEQKTKKRSTNSTGTVEDIVRRDSYFSEYVEPPKRDKIAIAIGATGLLIGVIGLVLAFATAGKMKQQQDQVSYLYKELVTTQTLQSKEHAAEVFGRYFLTYYYAGNKDALVPFLSKGDARYTQPETATILSTILKEVSLGDDNKTVSLTYVVSFKDTAGKTTTKQVSFDCIEKEDADYGWVVTAEPITKNFGPQQATTTEEKKE